MAAAPDGDALALQLMEEPDPTLGRVRVKPQRCKCNAKSCRRRTARIIFCNPLCKGAFLLLCGPLRWFYRKQARKFSISPRPLHIFTLLGVLVVLLNICQALSAFLTSRFSLPDTGSEEVTKDMEDDITMVSLWSYGPPLVSTFLTLLAVPAALSLYQRLLCLWLFFLFFAALAHMSMGVFAILLIAEVVKQAEDRIVECNSTDPVTPGCDRWGLFSVTEDFPALANSLVGFGIVNGLVVGVFTYSGIKMLANFKVWLPERHKKEMEDEGTELVEPEPDPASPTYPLNEEEKPEPSRQGRKGRGARGRGRGGRGRGRGRGGKGGGAAGASPEAKSEKPPVENISPTRKVDAARSGRGMGAGRSRGRKF